MTPIVMIRDSRGRFLRKSEAVTPHEYLMEQFEVLQSSRLGRSE